MHLSSLYLSRRTFSNRKMDAPRAAALSSTKRHMKQRVPFVSSKTPSSMADAYWSVKIASRVAVAVVVIVSMVNNTEEVAFKAITIVVVSMADISNISSTVLDSCPARLPKRGVKSTWATSHGRLDGVNSRITSVNVEKLNARRWPKVVMVVRRGLA